MLSYAREQSEPFGGNQAPSFGTLAVLTKAAAASTDLH